MSLHPDAALVAREPELPGLAGVLDAPGLAERAGLGRMRASYLLYKPRTSCIAGLVPENGDLCAWEARTYPEARYAEVRARRDWAKGAVFLDAEQTALLPLRLIRPKAARALAFPRDSQALLAALGLPDCDLTLLRFKPGRRVVLRADGSEGPRAVVKLYEAAAAFARARAGAAQSEAAGGPRLLAACPARRAIAIAWAPGTVLDASAPLDAFVRAGRELARTHSCAPRPGLSRWTAPDSRRIADTIAWLLPDQADRVRVIARRLSVRQVERAVAIHGDFSPDQVVLEDRRATILDWDRAAVGPAARDLGSFLASLDLDEARGASAAWTAGDALIAGYRAAGGQAEDEDIAAHRALALLALASEGFRARRPDWDHECDAALGRIEALLETPSRATAQLAAALDGNALASSLDNIVGGEAEAPVLLRLKPGRRAMIRYKGTGGAALGKLRAKGPDRTAPRVQAGLRAAGLDGSDGVAVPPVLGALDTPPVWFQAEVPGAPLGAMIDGPGAAAAMRRTGRALAALHGMPPQTERRWTLENELAVLRRALADGPYGDLAELAAARLEALPPGPDVGLHRDFYFDQGLVDKGTLWLVDLDLHAIGDAAVDIGNFLAHLTELGLRQAGDDMRHSDLASAFLTGYAERRAPPPEDRIDTLHWVSLARHVTIAKRFADRRATIPTIAALCRMRLGPAQLCPAPSERCGPSVSP